MEVLVARCAGLDVHQKTVMACVRVPGQNGQRVQMIREFRTFTAGLFALRQWLLEHQVTDVAMEATGVYWRPVWHVLEDAPGLELMLVNAHHVKKVPGRKTDVTDAAWLAQLLECGLLQGSFVPPAVIAQLRDLTRYRKKLVEDRTRETQRVQKVLEDAGIKLASVASDTLGVSGRAMLDALIDGVVTDPGALADLAKGKLRAKIADLELAMEGRFSDHHRALLREHLAHIDYLSAAIDRLDGQVAALLAPFDEQVKHLITIPGVGQGTAEVIIAEIGVDMSRFPTAGHLASWAGMCPGNHESAGKRRSGRTRHGNTALRSALVEAAWAASRSKGTYLSAQYWRLHRRFGKKGQNKALLAVGHSILVIAWHLLKNNTDYQDLGADYFDQRQDTDLLQKRLVQRLEELGNTVTLHPRSVA
jgi:transposase